MDSSKVLNLLSILFFLVIFGSTIYLSKLTENSTRATEAETNKLLSPTFVKLPSPTPTVITNEYSVWLNWWSGSKTVVSLEKVNGKAKTISPLWLLLNQGLELDEYPVKDKGNIKRQLSQMETSIIPTIGNDFDGIRINKLLNNGERRELFLDDLIDLINKNGYSGIDLDWEEVYKEDSDLYADFVRELRVRITDPQLKVIVTAHARTGTEADWIGSLGHDLNALSQYADEVRIMAYDYHSANSKPGPITPLDWLKDVIDYAQETISHDKLVIGLPLYGYKWPEEGKGYAVSYEEVMMNDVPQGLILIRDDESFMLNGSYVVEGKKYEIWVEDSVSVNKKVEIVNNKGINKMVFWALGGEDAQIWESLPLVVSD